MRCILGQDMSFLKGCWGVLERLKEHSSATTRRTTYRYSWVYAARNRRHYALAVFPLEPIWMLEHSQINFYFLFMDVLLA
jgi:hypothetical protein